MPTTPELITEVRDILDEPVAAQWSDEQLRRWLNEGNRDIARGTKHYKSTDSFTVINGVAEYTMDTNIIAIEMAYYSDGSRKIPLTARHYEQMDQLWGSYQDRVGAYPTHFTTWGRNTPNGTLTLRLWPVPTSDTDTVHLLTAILPADLPAVDDTTTQCDVPTAWYDALADYCEYKALRRDRNPASVEALNMYAAKRDYLINNPDYISANREVVPDPDCGWVPRWLAEF